MLFTALDLASITSHIHSWVLFCFGSVSSFFLELFLHWSPLTYWAPTNLGRSSFSVLYFCLFIISWGSQGKNTEVVWHSLIQWTMFCQNSPSLPVHLGWPYMAWLLSFIELDKVVVHVISLISFLWLWFSFCLPSDGWGKEACGSFLMRGTGCREKWALLL